MTLFVVHSRRTIERAPALDMRHVIVSITSDESDVARLPTSRATLGILRLSFSDRDMSYWPRVVEAPYPVRLFDEHDARAIVDFVEHHRAAIEGVVVHCHAGISRSPAVAAAIAAMLGDDDSVFFTRYNPNLYVHALLVAEWAQRKKEHRHHETG